MSALFDKIPNITLVCAGPNSGKSYLCKYILQDLFKNNKLKYGIVFCATSFNQSYDFLPKKYIYSQYDENKLIQFINLQIGQIKKSGKAEPAFIIFDDMIGSINFTSPLFNKLITTYRHYNILLIFTTQYLFKIPPVLRECCTYFVTFKQPTKKSVQAIYETFMNEMETYEECKRFIDSNTQDYQFILVKPFESDEKKYIVSKAPMVENIKINY